MSKLTYTILVILQIELAEGIVTTQSESGFKQDSKNVLGTYLEVGYNKFSIGIELSVLKNPTLLISTIAHELSHLILLGEDRLNSNDEELTDLNSIALGFGIFICNSIFTFDQWSGSTHQGWQAQKRGYFPEQVASYAFALLTMYQEKDYRSFLGFLNPSTKKMFEKNIKYLKSTKDEILFK